MFENKIVEGDNYNKLSKILCINILDFKYLKSDNFHNTYRLKEINIHARGLGSIYTKPSK